MFFLNLLPLFVTAVGTFFLVKVRFFFITHPIKTVTRLKRAIMDGESVRALSLALAGTLGVGNIVGVAFGISVGGAGAIFWIFVSGVFSAVIKYAESTLAADMKSGIAGGMMHVLALSFGRLGKVFGVIYSIFCLFLSLTMGSALQSQSALFAFREIVDIPQYAASAIFVIAVCIVIVLGSGKIEKITARIIPISTIVYILLCVSVVLINIKELLPCLGKIIREAFNFRSFGGGVSSFVAVRAIREGYARGLLSNEAGAGTSAMAQSRANLSAADVGLLGILEVFFDTTLLCTLTGITVLVSGADLSGGGMNIVLSAVSSIPLGKTVIALLILTFAYSTVVCWYYYGCECMRFLLGKRTSPCYTALFIFSVYIGFAFPTAPLIYTTDVLLFVMSILTLAALIKNSARIVFLTESSGLLKQSDIGKNGETGILK